MTHQPLALSGEGISSRDDQQPQSTLYIYKSRRRHLGSKPLVIDAGCKTVRPL